MDFQPVHWRQCRNNGALQPQKEENLEPRGYVQQQCCSMAVGAAGIGEIYTHQRALDFLDWSEAFRLALNDMFIERDMPMHCNGLGSIFATHFITLDQPLFSSDQALLSLK